MSFTYSAIGDNTRENREHLEKLGIKGYNRDRQFIIVHEGYYFCTDEYMKVHYPCVGCVNNPALFQAVTAMRDDSDKWQFFVHEDRSFVFCDQGELKHVIDNEYMYQEYAVSEFHKATLSELQEHFQRV